VTEIEKKNLKSTLTARFFGRNQRLMNIVLTGQNKRRARPRTMARQAPEDGKINPDPP
jgi:hypothetical protein